MAAPQAEHDGNEPSLRSGAVSALLSLGISVALACGFVIGSEECRHWFVIPVTLCGALIGRDAVDWWLGRVDRFDPVGILGMVGYHFFFLAPLLHVAWDSWMDLVVPPPDWRDCVGQMAIINTLGLLAYIFGRNLVPAASRPPAEPRGWRIDRRRFFVVVTIALVGTAVLQAGVYAQHGGILAYIEEATDANDQTRMQGEGWIYMISESFPLLAAMAFTVVAAARPAWRSWWVLVPALVAVLGLFVLFGGLRGQRSPIIWGLFWVVGMIHLWVRPITNKVIVAGVAFLLVFMYLYGFFKGYSYWKAKGLDPLAAVGNAEVYETLSRKSGRTWDALLLGDLGRTDVQAYLFYRTTMPDGDYEYAWGRTYAGTAAILIPRAIWPDRPPHKVKEGTEALYGKGTFEPEVRQASKVYGLAGETMLNFGPLPVPAAYLLFGLFVGWVRRWRTTLPAEDSRQLLLPFAVNYCFMIIVSDTDNLVFNLIKTVTVPFLVLALGSIRTTSSSAISHVPGG